MDLHTATAAPSETVEHDAPGSHPDAPGSHPDAPGSHPDAPASLSAPPEGPAEAAEKSADGPPVAKGPNLRRKKRPRAKAAHLIPAWAVSLAVHLVVLGSLAAVTLTTAPRKMVANINSALAESTGPKELTPIYADNSASGRDSEAVGIEHAPQGGAATAAGGAFGGIGTGPPSSTPVVSGVGSGVTEERSLPGIQISATVSGISLTPARANLELGGGGGITGDVTFEARGTEEALDQIAREILRLLGQHKLTVVWLFDESGSMKDDQKTIGAKFDRIASELKRNIGDDKKAAGALTHAVVGFGDGLHFLVDKPTADLDRVGEAIKKIPVDETGSENTMRALANVVKQYSGWIGPDRRMMIVLVTDESGDDGGYLQEAYDAVVKRGVPLYVIGRQSLFGYGRMHLKHVDPVTGDVYWPPIQRGPETADIELLQWDGLHERREEQPSGFAPYELARLAKASSGIYFLLPTLENQRVRQREQAYSIIDLKEYMPDYSNRLAYSAEREKSPFRSTLYGIIDRTKGYAFRTHFPIEPAAMIPAAQEAGATATARLNDLVAIGNILDSLEPLRGREPERRWQAHYDLIRAQIVAYQIKAYEYRACLAEMIQSPPFPKKAPGPGEVVEWNLHHSTARKAPKEQTEKKWQEAERRFRDVIARHPKTPWADLAQDELDRGFGVARGEWRHNKEYQKRQQYVPKF